MRLRRSLACAVLLAPPVAQTPSEPQGSGDGPYSPAIEPASNEGLEAMGKMRIPDGFELSLFAAEPMLANPVAFDVDHGGDVYVCETFRLHEGVPDMREHMGWLEDELANRTVEDRVAMLRRHLGEELSTYGTQHERIRLIRDTDGDGRADEAIVFADGFKDPADGIAAGVLSYRGDVFFTCIPSLWLLRDEDGDGRADSRRALSSGYGVHVALAGHDLHGLIVGPDGKLYFSCGDRGFHVETADGVIPHHETGAVLRCNLDGSELEVFHTGLRNPQELAFDDHGNLFTGDNNSDGGDEARWVQVVEGADSGWRFHFQHLTDPILRGPWNDEKLWLPHHAGQPAYVLPPIANLANGPAGLVCYPGTGLPETYAGHFFLCDFRGDASFSGIHTFTNVPRGAGFELGPVEPFVWRTLATDCTFGPDGAFYFSDWVHGWTRTGKGRIYRLVHPDHGAGEVAGLLAGGLGEEPVAELEALLGHGDRRIRQEAQFELARRGASSTLGRAAASSPSPIARLHGIWGLGMIARTRRDLLDELEPLLGSSEPEVRAQAARVLGDLCDEGAAPGLIELLGDPSPRVRMYAAIGLGRIGSKDAADGLFALVEAVADTDAVLRHAAVMGLVGCADPERLEAEADHPDPHVRMAVVLVLRRREDPFLRHFLDDPDPRIRREAVIAIHDLPVREALPALADRIAGSDLEGNAVVRRVLNANLRLGNDVEAGRRMARYALRVDQAPEHRAEALDMLAGWADPSNVDRVLGRWIELGPRDASYLPGIVEDLAAEALADGTPDRVVRAFLRLVLASRAEGVADLLAALARQAERPAATRVAALEVMAKLSTPNLHAAVREALADAEGTVRAAALAAMRRLDPVEALPLIEVVLEHGTWPERGVALESLGSMRAGAADRLLAKALGKLEAGLFPAELALDLVLAIEQRGTILLPLISERARQQREADSALGPYLDSLFGGSRIRGKRIFEKDAELSCLRCHRVAKEGTAQIGPDLARVGRRLTRIQLLESIVDPNRHVTAGFGTMTVFLADGSVVEGRVLEEGETALTLVDSDGEILELAREDVEERRPGLSAMPNGLGESISRTEMRDLIEYLAGL